MIDRLRTCLRALLDVPPATLQAAEAGALRRDCSDALRLQLDCMQMELGGSARDALQRLNDLLEDPRANGSDLAEAVRAASRVMLE